MIRKRLTALIFAVLLAGSSGRSVSAREADAVPEREPAHVSAGCSALGVVGIGIACAGGMAVLITTADRAGRRDRENRGSP